MIGAGQHLMLLPDAVCHNTSDKQFGITPRKAIRMFGFSPSLLTRRHFLIRPVALCAMSLLFGSAALVPSPSHAQAGSRRVDHVIIISIDGGKPAVMQKSRMPVLTDLMNKGAGTWEARTTFPSITLTSHTSMLTGVGPMRHHVLWNEWIPQRGVVQVPTIFSLAKEQKLSTAMIVAKQKFVHLFLPGSLDAFALPSSKANIVAQAAAYYIQERKPNLLFIHFADPDSTGHASGWGSPEQVAAFEQVDAGLGVIRDAINSAGIASRCVVIISADHGGHDKSHGSDSPEDMIIPWITWGAGVAPGTKIAAPVTTFDTAATALWLLGIEGPRNMEGKPVTSAFRPSAASASASATGGKANAVR